MWIRKLVKNGSAISCVIPPEALSALGWKRGDSLVIRMKTVCSLELMKVDFVSLPDRMAEELKEITNTTHERRN